MPACMGGNEKDTGGHVRRREKWQQFLFTTRFTMFTEASPSVTCQFVQTRNGREFFWGSTKYAGAELVEAMRGESPDPNRCTCVMLRGRLSGTWGLLELKPWLSPTFTTITDATWPSAATTLGRILAVISSWRLSNTADRNSAMLGKQAKHYLCFAASLGEVLFNTLTSGWM